MKSETITLTFEPSEDEQYVSVRMDLSRGDVLLPTEIDKLSEFDIAQINLMRYFAQGIDQIFEASMKKEEETENDTVQ